MGTKVHCKTYLPGYHATRDLNEDANFSWSPFCEDKTFSRQLFNNFKPRGVSSWSDFDKEMLKRTMLEHEAIFQKQLYELHRIYRIQKELMCELKTKQRNRLHPPLETSNSSMYISQLYPEFDEKMWHLRYPQVVSAYWSSENVEGSGDKKASSQVENFSRRILDLHLPAEAFIEKEDVEKAQSDNVCHPCITSAKTFDMIHGIEANNDVKLQLGSVQIPGTGKGTMESDLQLRNGLSVHRLADLNEPVVDSIDTEAVNLCSQPRTPIESKTISPQMNLFNDQSSNLNIKVEIGQEKQQFCSFSEQSKMFDSSFNSSLFKDEYQISSKLLKSNFDKAQESRFPDRMQADTMLQENFAHSNGNNGFQDLLNSKISGCKASQVASSLSDISRFSSATAIFVSASSWGKLTKTIDHTPVSVQAFQCSNTTSISNGEGTSIYRNSNFYETQKHMHGLDFPDVKHVKDLRLRSAFHHRIQDDATDEQNLFKKHDESSTNLFWLKERSSCNAFVSSKECETRLGLGFDKDKSHLVFTELQGEEIMDKCSSICALRHSTLSVDAKRTQLACGGICSVNDDARRKSNFSNSASYNGQPLHNYAKIHGKEMNDINLNCEPTITDNNLFGIPAEAKKEVPSLTLVGDSGKPKCRIDLETPADELEEEEDNTISHIDLLNIDYPNSKVEMSGDKKLSQDICTRLAADAIVTMSKESHNFSDKISTFPSLPSSCDSLHLLAEVVSFNAESCEVHVDHELDVFESMILELKELKADEYICKLSQHERSNNVKSMASLLSRPRRGQARRRQRRDFQKDVLPGLASLSRHEAIEDLQALGRITRTGKARQTSAQSKGGRRPITITEACYSPAQIHPVHTELENVGKKMMTWGRTTRRCPRQRVPSNR